MSTRPIRRALISVSDKQGLVELARRLVTAGVELVSTGGTARALQAAGLSVTSVSGVTGFPEIMGGRVKTLHPRIHGGVLGRWDVPADVAEAQAHGVSPFELVVVNLYPFRETIAQAGITDAQAIEQIDIGGPTLLRAAAKNHAHVTVVVDPDDYAEVADAAAQGTTAELRARLARKAFAHTAGYDAAIVAWMTRDELLPDPLVLAADRAHPLRYGENPHQRAAFYALPTSLDQPSLARARQLGGKALSYNNLLDLDAALAICLDLRGPAAVVVKHGNPCGAAEATDADEPLHHIYARARATDPMSAFGGIVALNQPVDALTAERLVETFLEAVIAPAFLDEALPILARKKSLRLLAHDPWPAPARHLEFRRVAGGLLVQDRDDKVSGVRAGDVVTQRQPTEREWAAMDFAWRVARHVKSNAIVFARAEQLLGVGAGQMSRVDASRIASQKAREAGHELRGSAIASDAFFPFADGVEAAADAGATAVVQPGGSVRDPEVIVAADRLGLTMVFTGARHFRH
ncbi:MAG: bifunctional phosphoribosylaminoimidazolecarboxamide formyltransferase/IMP cyclohydrolase [Myxococcales bacterium]|nr:bifunctional phosphoribosylaminoimidazolecarboxamide formyltransferase/IMP cyclohydrolase [Myxococcales bacterium]